MGRYLKYGKKSIRFSLNRLVILPLICLGTIMLGVSIPFIYGAIASETEEGLKNISYALLEKCNVMGEGDYSIENGILNKGGVPFGQDGYVVDSVKAVSGIDATIFGNDTRMITTIKKENGERAVGTRASQEVNDVVIKHGQAYFSSRVEVNGVYYYGYYVPLKNSDDSVVGMVFAGKSRKNIMHTMFSIIAWEFIVIVGVVAAAAGICLWYAGGIVNSLNKTREFLGNVAQGNLSCEIDKKLVQRSDEIGEMGRFALILQKSILKLIGTDPLTGLYNRRSSNEVLEKAIYEYQCEEKRCEIAIGDIDNFKRLNDTYGHLAGDEVLKKLSKILQENMQGKGVAARWGGEEFLLIYNNGQRAQQEVEQLLKEIRGAKISYKEQMLQVTMTFGLSICRQKDTVETIIKRADDRLYTGKKSGKDQMVAK